MTGIDQDQDQALVTPNIVCVTFAIQAPVLVQDGNQHLQTVLNRTHVMQLPVLDLPAVNVAVNAKPNSTTSPMAATYVAQAHPTRCRTGNVHDDK